MLDKVKLALRVTASAFDEEVTDLIAAAKADLRLVGINVPEDEEGSPAKTVGDPLIERAIILYAKAEFGYNGDGERYRKAYDYLKCALSLAGDYNAVE
ncbi:MAG: DNA-packaging protein [Clostridia bacterium]|nr:DNA-packaging protein [Clostridia bacterium]MBQ4269939.1 DNA-packaging protein [Clostridia bacterium]